jgi:heme iron utilization protein
MNRILPPGVLAGSLRYIGLVSNRQHAGPGPATSNVPEPSLAERARTLAAIGLIGSLSTHSRKFPGFPFGSMMPFAVDQLGRPVFFISSMAMHTQNLLVDGRASLLITQPDVSGDPLGSARLTLVGTATVASAAEVRDLYLSRYENARYWQDYTDFAYYWLEVEGVYFIGGFGVMGWVTVEDYASATPDPLATVAPGIIQHMNADHGDALRRIARHDIARESDETGPDEAAALDEATITAVDRLGFHVRLKTGDRVHGRRIAFPREVKDSSDARAVFIEMLRASS